MVAPMAHVRLSVNLPGNVTGRRRINPSAQPHGTGKANSGGTMTELMGKIIRGCGQDSNPGICARESDTSDAEQRRSHLKTPPTAFIRVKPGWHVHGSVTNPARRGRQKQHNNMEMPRRAPALSAHPSLLTLRPVHVLTIDATCLYCVLPIFSFWAVPPKFLTRPRRRDLHLCGS